LELSAKEIDMKVSFSLTSNQSLIALAVKANMAIKVIADQQFFYMDGNLSPVFDTGYGAKKQTMSLSEDSRTITFEGGRTTLVDGVADCINTLKKIAGGDLNMLKVTEYVTSDTELHWWETAAESINRRTTTELIDMVGRVDKNTNLAWFVSDELRKRTDTKLSALLERVDMVKVSAGWTQEEIKIQRRINACILRVCR
jgi:hypothetical protein